MPKFRFLCHNHRQWLTENPAAVQHTWGQCYSRSLELLEDGEFTEAANQAGAAFETAEICLQNSHNTSALEVHRYADTGALLAQILEQMGEKTMAQAVIATAIARLENSSFYGLELRAARAGSERLVHLGEHLNSAGLGGVGQSDASYRYVFGGNRVNIH